MSVPTHRLASFFIAPRAEDGGGGTACRVAATFGGGAVGPPAKLPPPSGAAKKDGGTEGEDARTFTIDSRHNPRQARASSKPQPARSGARAPGAGARMPAMRGQRQSPWRVLSARSNRGRNWNSILKTRSRSASRADIPTVTRAAAATETSRASVRGSAMDAGRAGTVPTGPRSKPCAVKTSKWMNF